MNRQHLGDQYESIWRDSNISFKARVGTIDTTANNVVQTLNLTPKVFKDFIKAESKAL